MDYKQKIVEIRQTIDQTDREILRFLAHRMEAARQIRKLKKDNNIPQLDKNRWWELLFVLKQEGNTLSLDESLIEDIWNRIHEESLREES